MKRNRIKNAGAALSLLALGLMAGTSAQACSLAAWTSNTGAPVAGEPGGTPSVQKYSGRCGLQAANPGPSFVTESTNHAAEGGASPFRARFFVLTGLTAGTPVVFRAADADVAGNNVIEITYDAVDQNFDFTVNGSTTSTPAGSAPRNRWVTVRFDYQASTAFSASTRVGGVDTALPSPQTPGAGTVERVELGMIQANGAVGTLTFDEYESSRAASGSAPFTNRCMGDANGSGFVSAGDRAAITAEIAGTLASGQADCNESGFVSAGDRACVTALIANPSFSCTPFGD